MSTASTLIAAAGGLLGLLTLVAAAWAVIRSGYTAARADDAEKRIAALRGEIADKDRREEDLLEAIQDLTRRVAEVERENKTLRSLVPTSNQLAEIRASQEMEYQLHLKHFDEATTYIKEWRVNRAWLRDSLDMVIGHLKQILRAVGGGNA